MKTKKNIISKRYLNDRVPLVSLNEIQKKYLNQFLNDNRINYKIVFECFLCKGDNFVLIAEKDRYAIPLETIVCQNCGLVRNYKQLDEESSKIFYSEYYRKIYGFTSLDKNALDDKYRKVANRKISNYINVPKDKIILEIGCGGGWNLMAFHNAGHKYYGFDFDKDFIDYGKSKGLNLYLGGVEEVIKMGVKCDYLLLDQVLEHVYNPVNFLVSLKPLLNNNAIIDIYVPSLDLLLWGYVGCNLLSILQNAHNFLFDEFTLKVTANIAKFEIINCVATNLVLKNSSDKMNLSYSISKLNRGKDVVKYLKFVEKNFIFRKRIGIEKISFKKMYCILRPIGCYKRFIGRYFGKI